MAALRLILALSLGALLGYGFGLVQLRALRRYEKRQAAGKLKYQIGMIPGSLTRVAMLLIVLALIQVPCQMLFSDGSTPWWVSGGVVLGYAYLIRQHLQERRKAG
jgi:hypothetical protein